MEQSDNEVLFICPTFAGMPAKCPLAFAESQIAGKKSDFSKGLRHSAQMSDLKRSAKMSATEGPPPARWAQPTYRSWESRLKLVAGQYVIG